MVVSALTVRYGSRVAVDGVSLAADCGEVLAILGRNGAGKTSTVECCEGYLAPAAGTVRVLGMDPVSQRVKLAQDIGVMLQQGGVHPTLSPRRALDYFARLYPEPADPKSLLGQLGLDAVASTPFRRLSGGEKQRVLLGLALLPRPKVLFLDEPTSGVDPTGRAVIRQLIRDLRSAGRCIILTTHELGEAELIADRVAILDRGRRVAYGSIPELTAKVTPSLRFSTDLPIDVPALARTLGAGLEEVGDREYLVEAEPSPDLIAQLTAWLGSNGVVIGEMRAGRHRLEEIFASVLAEDEPRAELGPAGSAIPKSGDR